MKITGNEWFDNIFLPNLRERINLELRYDHTMILSAKQARVCEQYMPFAKNNGFISAYTNREYVSDGYRYTLYYYGNYTFLSCKEEKEKGEIENEEE